MLTAKRLSDVFNRAPEIIFNDESKIIIMSDSHRGDGNWNDEFARNQNIFFRALLYYYNQGFTYIELGDGDELWEVKKECDIIEEHKDVFLLLAEFYRNNRLYMIYGNHDICKKNYKLNKEKFRTYFSHEARREKELLPEIKFYEGLILKEENSDNRIFLVHGHQGEILSDWLWPVGRFLVRYLWRNLELLGIKDPTRVGKNNNRKNYVEKKLVKWSKDNNQMLIAGHTHRPMFPSLKEDLYFNDGSGVHPRSITGIEIENGEITLIKWSVKACDDGMLFIDRDVLEGPVKLKKYLSLSNSK